MKLFVNENYNPLMMHIFVIEAMNIPSKMDLFVSGRLERDGIGAYCRLSGTAATAHAGA